MNNLSIATKASIQAEIDGVEYLFSPLVVNDLGELCSHIQFHDFRQAQANCNLEEPHRGQILAEVFKTCLAKPVVLNPTVLDETMRAHPYLQNKMIYLSLHHKHEDITQEDVDQFSQAGFHLAMQVLGGFQPQKKVALAQKGRKTST